jgi:hypothetical protein
MPHRAALAIGARPSLYNSDGDKCRRSWAECLLGKLRDKMAVSQVEYVCRRKRDRELQPCSEEVWQIMLEWLTGIDYGQAIPISSHSIEPHDIGTCALQKHQSDRSLSIPHAANLVWTDLGRSVTILPVAIIDSPSSFTKPSLD